MTTSPSTVLRIFISHSHKDNEFGVKLVEDLRRVLGDESAVWYDAKGGLHGGDTWWSKIIEEITARNIFIVVLSPDSMSSPWVNDEINLAWRQKNSPEGKRIFPILYRQCKSRGDLDTLHNINFLPPRTYEDAFNDLLIALGLPPNTGISQSTRIPDDPDTVFVRQITPQIEASFAAKDWTDVIRKTNFLLKRAPVAVTSEIYRMQGVAFFEEGQMQQAQEAFEAALALVSDRGQRLAILRNYADLLVSQDQWSEVLRLANEALRLVPKDQNWIATQQQVKARVQRAALAAQRTKEQWLDEGNAAYDAGRYEEAIAAYNYAITLDSKNSWAFTRRGDAYRMLKEYQQAIRDFNRAIDLDPMNDFAYTLRGDTYRLLSDYQRAIQDCTQAITLDLNKEAAYTSRGDAYRMLGEHERAIQDLDHAVELFPNNALTYVIRGEVYQSLNSSQRAIQDFDRAIELDPKFAWAYGTRGRACSSLKQYQRAIQDFNRALELDSTLDWVKTDREKAYRLLKNQR